MLGLDHNAPYLLVAFGLTVVVLLGYTLYLRSRLAALRRATAGLPDESDYSARNVSAAAPRPTTAQAASSANGSSAP
jgi:hypothetical protein